MQAFYQAGAGLSAEHAESDHVVLASPAFQLVVHRVPEPIAASVEIENPPRRRTETPIKLVFWVASIAMARAMALRHGGELLDPDREWEFQGALVCDGQDPEGNVVSSGNARPRRGTETIEFHRLSRSRRAKESLGVHLFTERNHWPPTAIPAQ